jgi:hypothetical protein
MWLDIIPVIVIFITVIIAWRSRKYFEFGPILVVAAFVDLAMLSLLCAIHTR